MIMARHLESSFYSISETYSTDGGWMNRHSKMMEAGCKLVGKVAGEEKFGRKSIRGVVLVL